MSDQPKVVIVVGNRRKVTKIKIVKKEVVER